MPLSFTAIATILECSDGTGRTLILGMRSAHRNLMAFEIMF